MLSDPSMLVDEYGFTPDGAIAEFLLEGLQLMAPHCVAENHSDGLVTYEFSLADRVIFVAHNPNEERIAIYPSRDAWEADEHAMLQGYQFLACC